MKSGKVVVGKERGDICSSTSMMWGIASQIIRSSVSGNYLDSTSCVIFTKVCIPNKVEKVQSYRYS
jgi:hypothetical protein